MQAAREPDLGTLAKEALVRTASAPEVDPPGPVAVQTSGLDWSGSIEAGPTLIGSRQHHHQRVRTPIPSQSLSH